MTAQDLKNSILQLAVQGKLVPQNPDDEPASVLLEKIKAEKARLVKDGKMKQGKPLPAITEDEIPFEIPESWCWVRLNDVAVLIMGQSPDGNTVSNSSKGIEFHQGKVYFADKYLRVSEQKTNTPTKIVTANTTLLSVRAPVGAVNITEREICIGRGLCGFQSLQDITSDFYLFFLKAFEREFLRKATGTTFVAVTAETIRQQIFPLPPLAEQQRIVDKINELLPMIDVYGKAESELTAFNIRFPDDLKKSVLQYAVQGKLVEQNPDDEPASVLLEKIKAEKARLVKEKKIKADKVSSFIFKGEDGSYYENVGGEIKNIDEEIPFEIPESWVWVRIGDIAKKIGAGSTPTGGKSVYSKSGIKFIRSQNVYDDGLRLENIAYITEAINKAKKGSIVQAKDILLNITGGSIGRCALVPDNFDIANVNQHVLIIRLVNEQVRMFLHTCIISNYIQKMIMDVQVGVSREGLSATKLMSFIVPFPPLAEQQRIVEKAEELLGFCDRLN